MTKLAEIQYTLDGKKIIFKLTGQKINIGRKNTNSLILKDPLISREHAVILFENNKYIIKDKNSAHGVFLNNKRIKECILNERDRIKIGNTELLFFDRQPLPQTEEKESPGIKIKEDGVIKKETTLIRNVSELTNLPGIFDSTIRNLEKRKDLLNIEEEVLRLEKVNRYLQVLHQLRGRLNSIKDIESIFSLLFDTIFKLIEAERIVLIKLNEENNELSIELVKHKECALNKKLEISRTIADKAIRDRVSILTFDARYDDRFKDSKSIFLSDIRSVMCVPLWNNKNDSGLLYIDNCSSAYSFKEEDMILTTIIANQCAVEIENIRLIKRIHEEEIVRRNLERYHSPDIVKIIMQNLSNERTDFTLQPEDKEATILFADIEGFTSMTENLGPKEVARILNEYFNEMTDIIFAYNGTLDKYIGDGIMAVFGAPFSHGNDAENAVNAALDMIKRHTKIKESKTGKNRFNVRIGLST
ncbi:MAG: adenylate/guanylate cyclase domain-containing protein [Thermodesulfobacteriota bacterium]|nr:adenylate/guanylate cyclase domain-containing protein [Thermodesulfobacteriota bacterium]